MFYANVMLLVLIIDFILELDLQYLWTFYTIFAIQKSQYIVYIERVPNHSDWIIYVLLTCIVLLAILRARFPYRFLRLLQLTFQTNFLQLYNRDIDQRHAFTFISTFLNILSTSLFLFICGQYFLPEKQIEGLGWYIRITTLYTIFLLGKLWIEKIIGVLISRAEEVSKYTHEKLIYRNLLSIYILIWNIILLFILDKTQLSMSIAWLSIVLLNVLSLISSYKRNSSYLFSHYIYFILYLCTLEIGPYILIIYALVGV